MADSNLSQEEINALLEGADEIPVDPPDISGAQKLDKEPIRDNEMSKIVELMNQNLEYQTNAFHTIYNRAMNYSNLKAFYKQNNELISEFSGTKLIQVHINFSEGLSGDNFFVFDVDDALGLAEAISSTKQTELNEAVLNSISEGLLQMSAAGNTFLGQRIGKIVNIAKPQVEILDNSSKLRFPKGTQSVHVKYTLNPDGYPPIHMNQVLSVQLAKEFINIQKQAETGDYYGTMQSYGSSDAKAAKDAVTVRPVLFSQLELREHKENQGKINLLLDISMQLTVELGRTQKRIREILQWSEGSVVDLTTHAGEPSYLYVNGKLVAKGEIQVMPGDDTFGIRLTEIISSKERL
jgi:flagellar motor switch protein FliN